MVKNNQPNHELFISLSRSRLFQVPFSMKTICSEFWVLERELRRCLLQDVSLVLTKNIGMIAISKEF